MRAPCSWHTAVRAAGHARSNLGDTCTTWAQDNVSLAPPATCPPAPGPTHHSLVRARAHTALTCGQSHATTLLQAGNHCKRRASMQSAAVLPPSLLAALHAAAARQHSPRGWLACSCRSSYRPAEAPARAAAPTAACLPACLPAGAVRACARVPWNRLLAGRSRARRGRPGPRRRRRWARRRPCTWQRQWGCTRPPPP